MMEFWDAVVSCKCKNYEMQELLTKITTLHAAAQGGHTIIL